MIKNTTLFLAMIFCTILSAQENDVTPCRDAPTFEFEGTDVDFTMLISDVLIDPAECQGLVYHRHRSDVVLDPIEYDDKYIIFYNTGDRTGERVLALDKETNAILWDSSYNFMVDEQNRAFRYASHRKLQNGTLELKTIRGIEPWDNSSIPGSPGGRGLLGRRIIDPNSGATLSDYWVGDTVEIAGVYWPSLAYSSVVVVNQNYTFLENQGMYVLNSIREPTNNESYTLEIYPYYTDSLTLLHVPTDSVENPIPKVYLNHVDQNGNKGHGYSGFGPIASTDGRYFWIYQYALNWRLKTVQIFFDSKGRFIEEVPIDEYNHDKYRIRPFSSKQLDNRIILPSTYSDDTEEKLLNYTYVVLDRNGKKIHGREKLIFDNLTPSDAITYYMEDRKSYLHIFRPKENHNVYIYEEYEDGSYRKAGELKPQDDASFVPRPKNLWRMDNGDFFVHMNMTIDSIHGTHGRYRFKGWSSMLKIDADALGLKTSTTEVTSTNSITLYPNPTADKVHFQTEDALHLEVYNVTGRRLDSETIEAGSSYDLSGHSQGIYFFHMHDEKGRLLGVEKVVRL